jgi:hypothetical protein
VTFGKTDKDFDKKIEFMTRQITGLFRKCESNVKRVVPSQEELKKMKRAFSPQEVDLRRNVMKGIVAQIMTESKKFKELQEEFVSKMRKRDEFPKDIGFSDNEDEVKEGHITIQDIIQHELTETQIRSFAKSARRTKFSNYANCKVCKRTSGNV